MYQLQFATPDIKLSIKGKIFETNKEALCNSSGYFLNYFQKTSDSSNYYDLSAESIFNSEENDNSFDEQLIIQIFSGKKIIYSEENFDTISSIAADFQMEKLLNSIQRYSEYLDYILLNDEIQYDFMNELCLCELYLYNLNKSNFDDTICSAQRFIETVSFELFCDQIFMCYISRQNDLDLYLDFINKLGIHKEFSRIVLKFHRLSKGYGSYYQRTNYFFNSNVKHICFLFVKENIYEPDDFDHYDIVDFEHIASEQVPNEPLFDIIMDDDIEALQRMSCNEDFDFDDIFRFSDNSIFSILNNQSLIVASAFFGSIKCFRFLLINNANLPQNIPKYAIAGGNLEIVRICVQNNLIFDNDCLKSAIIYKHFEIFKWLVEQEVFSFRIKENLDLCLIYHNYNTFYYLFQRNETNLYAFRSSAILSNNKLYLDNIPGNFVIDPKDHDIMSILHTLMANDDPEFFLFILSKMKGRYSFDHIISSIPRKNLITIISNVLENKNIKISSYKEISRRLIEYNEIEFFKEKIAPLLKKVSNINFILEILLKFNQNELFYYFFNNYTNIDFSLSLCKSVIKYRDDLDLIKLIYSKMKENEKEKLNNGNFLIIVMNFYRVNIVKFLLEEVKIKVTTEIFLNSVNSTFEIFSLIFQSKGQIPINVKLHGHESLLFNAISNVKKEESEKIITFLLNLPDIDKNIKGYNETTPFLYSCQMKSSTFKLFYNDQDVDINARNGDGKNALVSASGNPDIINYFLTHPSNRFTYTTNDIILCIKENYSSFSCFKDKLNEYNFSDNDICEIFREACSNNDENTVQSLLSNEKYHIDVNYGNVTPLILAISNNHLNIVKLLINHPDILLNKTVERFYFQYFYLTDVTPLFFAVVLSSVDLLNLLLTVQNKIDSGIMSKHEYIGRYFCKFIEMHANSLCCI
ncbi:hypothetical protein TRFO_35726 [Tritrichomonas foetus]|uniref:BTB domain-containing protein n=1 Tax=Tritrichomonas foetus TaxID=1144522 RepID=A0A1J4JK45_9EUKA|nr:hypothetical protein TRFO_35726 [Tritrichomonas foetus]|eukprot:OHS97933.1 hypothetical protein TRFO_35726 [Tritrichomonas foetus]